MANASGLDAALLELGRSMPVSTIPEKLRCVTCDKLAINAWKLPCCENTICTDCHQEMTGTECPICTHSPFDPSTCVPAKSLQATVKAFLKTAVKKRSSEAAAQDKKSASTTPLATTKDQKALPLASTQEDDIQKLDNNDEREISVNESPGFNQVGSNKEEQIQDMDIPMLEASEDQAGGQDDNDDDQEQIEIKVDGEANLEQNNGQLDHQQGMELDQTMNNFQGGNFPHTGGYNPMMSMQFGMGMPNIMGMPGMGMDQSMMFNGGFGNGNGMGDMGMMGMGMGMGGGLTGMAGIHGMGGPAYFQPQPSYMQSNFGSAQRQPFFNDRGYGRPYGRGFGRGGRGVQYGRGRGGWSNHHHQQYSHQQTHFQNDANVQDQAANRRGSPNYDSMQTLGTDGNDDNLSMQPAQPEEGQAQTIGDQSEQTPSKDVAEDSTDIKVNEDQGGIPHPNDQPGSYAIGKMPLESQPDQNTPENVNADAFEQYNAEQFDKSFLDSSKEVPYGDGSEDLQYQQQYGFGASIRGRGGFRGRAGYGQGGHSRSQDSTDLTPTPTAPLNAPTGPKAMRQGLPNTGWSGRVSSAPQKQTSQYATEEDEVSSNVKDDYRHGRERDSRSRSRSQHRSRRYQGRDEGDSGLDEDDERRKDRDRRKRRERERERERERRYEDENYDKGSEDKKHRSRSESPIDGDLKRRRRRDKDDGYRHSRSHRDRSRSRHRRRHRSRSPRKDTEDSDEVYSRRHSRTHADHDDSHDDGDRVREKEKSRRHSRRDDNYDQDKKERSHRSSKAHRTTRDEDRDRDFERDRPRAIIEPPSDELGFKIKGSRSARVAKDSTMGPPSAPSKRESRSSMLESASASTDPYAEERARAQQGREAREVQRRQSTKSSHSSSLLGKRSSRADDDDELDAPRGPKGDRGRSSKGPKERRMNYRYEDEIYRYDDEDEDDDRNGGRWR